MAWAPDYTTGPDFFAYLRVGDLDDEVAGALAITSASRAVDDHCNRQFGRVDAVEQRIYPADYYGGRWVVDIDDLMTTTGLIVDVDGTLVPTHQLEPRNAAQIGRPWTRLVFTSDSESVPTSCGQDVLMTARWGWTAFPTQVVQATHLQASRFFSRRNSPHGIAGSPEMGSETRLLSKLDPDVAVGLRGLVRPRAVG